MNNKFGLRIVATAVLLLCVFTLRLYFVSPPEVDQQHAFHTDRAFERLSRILGDEASHPVDSRSNDEVRERLLNEIRLLGFSPIVRDDFHCSEGRHAMRCSRVRNVMFWLDEQGPNAVMVASHYDSVPAGPGAADDGAGVAASLEIAAILKARNLARPVLVLITDGEEIGLVGAASFVDKDPFAKLISAVVSMEARGVSGPVAMFQTSTPNGRDIAALKSDIKTAFTSSLASDVYEKMPNGTDVTEYLALDIDVGNFAIGGSPEFYHTARDNLAMLDKRSFFHMGASALNTVEGFLKQSGDESEQQWIYTDIFGLVVLALPQLFGLPLIVLGGLAVLVVFTVKGSGSGFWPRLGSLVFPFLAIVLGVGFALAATLGVDAMRSEVHYAAAHPWALRAAQNTAALLGVLLAFMLLGRSRSPQGLLMSSWLCLAILGGALSMFFPGAAILFVPPLMVITLSCVLSIMNKHKMARNLSLLAAFLFSIIVVPTSALGEMMLFPEYAAPFTIFLVFCFLLFAPLALPSDGVQEKLKWTVPAAMLCVTCTFIAVAVFVPAYSPAAPRGLSVLQVADVETGSAKFAAFSNDPLPKAMNDIAPFSRGSVAGFEQQAYVAKAPNFETLGVNVRVERNQVVGEERLVTLQIEAPDSDIIVGRVKQKEVAVLSMTLNSIAKTEAATSRFSCHGRGCRSLTITLAFSANAASVDFQVNGFRYGLDAGAKTMLSARPKSALARNWGDLRLVSKTVTLN
ncbi:MAG: hypothetical protein ACJAQ6_000464 [Arenicella sp.]|jgi:hypothetical protein